MLYACVPISPREPAGPLCAGSVRQTACLCPVASTAVVSQSCADSACTTRIRPSAPATNSNRSSIRAAIRCTAPINAPGPPPTIPSRSRRFFPSLAFVFAVIPLAPFQLPVACSKHFEQERPVSFLALPSASSVISAVKNSLRPKEDSIHSESFPAPLIQSQHPPIPPLIRPRTREIIKSSPRRLNDMPLNKRRPFRRSLFAAFDAALPHQHRPSRKLILRQLGKYGAEIHLAISRRTKPAGPIYPGLIAPVNALPSCRTKLRILHVKHLDPAVIKIDELQIIEPLQHEMARIKKHIASRMIAHTLQKHFKRHPIVQIFARMNLKAQIHPRLFKCIQDGTPASRQLFKSRFNQPGGPLRPRIQIRTSQRPAKRNMCRKSQIGRRARSEQQLFNRPRLPRSRIAPQLLRRKPIKGQVIRGMHRHQLSLKVRRKFRDGKPAARHRAADLVAVSLTLCRSPQIKQARIPTWNLYPLVAELGGPRCDALQTVERGRIARELRQKNPRPFNRSHRSLNSTLHPR